MAGVRQSPPEAGRGGEMKWNHGNQDSFVSIREGHKFVLLYYGE